MGGCHRRPSAWLSRNFSGSSLAVAVPVRHEKPPGCNSETCHAGAVRVEPGPAAAWRLRRWRRRSAATNPAGTRGFGPCPGYVAGTVPRLLTIDRQPGSAQRYPSKSSPSDLVQQSLAEAWQGFDAFRGRNEPELRRWLRRILLNNVRDTTGAFRNTARRGGVREIPICDDQSRDGIGERLVSAGPSPSGCATRQEDLERLAGKLQEIPSHYAEVIRLRNIEYLPFAEIGKLMGLKPDAARKLWERAVRRLASELGSNNDQSRTGG